jgi:hypothetical protein
MSNAVIICAMICVTILAICWMGRNDTKKENEKGGRNNGNH